MKLNTHVALCGAGSLERKVGAREGISGVKLSAHSGMILRVSPSLTRFFRREWQLKLAGCLDSIYYEARSKTFAADPGDMQDALSADTRSRPEIRHGLTRRLECRGA